MIKKNIRKRGQAALEFLTTYGWAFMVILVMIGALAYFGVLNPDRFLPQRCNIGPEFSCEEFGIFYDDSTPDSGELQVILTNNVGQTITEMNVNTLSWPQGNDSNVANCDVTTDDFDSNGGTAISTASARAGDSIYLECDSLDVDAFPPYGGKLAMNVDATYDRQGRSISQPISMEVFATVQES